MDSTDFSIPIHPENRAHLAVNPKPQTNDQINLQPDSNNTNNSAVRILEPQNKNISTIEAARVYNVYEGLTNRLKILLNLEIVKEFLDSDPALLELARKSAITERIRILLALKASSNSSQEEIENEAKNLCRAFHHNSDLENVVISFLDMRNTPIRQSRLLNSVNDLKKITNERLRTLPSEEIEREQYLIKITKKQDQNVQILQKLEEQLAADKTVKDRELSTLEEDLRKLKSDLYQLEQFTEEQIRRTRTEIEKQNQSDTKNSEQRQKKLRLETDDLKLKHGQKLIEHLAEEEQLRRKKANIEKQIEEWIDKYDNEAGALQKELDREGEEHENLCSQYDKLMVGFETLKVDYDKIMEERRIQHKKMEMERREVEEKTGAAQVIQAFFRSYKVRKAMKKKGKGKGKKGKK